MRNRLRSSKRGAAEPEFFLTVKLADASGRAYCAFTLTPKADSERATILCRSAAICLALASLVVIALHAWHDRRNAFPDEYLHALTAAFYLDHWLPPAMSEALAPYAGVHGVSYHMLWPPQAAYLVFAKATSLFVLGDNARLHFYRGLCVALWLALLLQIVPKLKAAPWMFWLIGLTPAVWYVFSYFSPDALSYATAATLVVQLGSPDSIGRRYLATGRPLFGAFALGALIGVLATSKLNYITFSVSAFAYCVLLLWRHRALEGFATRSVVVVCVGCAVAGPLLVADLANNGIRREARFEELREKFAGPGFHASDIANGTAYYGYVLRERGIKPAALFHRPWRWGLLTSRSFYGVYGTMDVDHWPWLNDLQFLLGLMLLGLGVACRRRTITPEQWIFAGVAVSMCGVALAAAFWRAWTFDFQAQGRYCFAIIPIIVLVMLELCDARQRILHWGLAAAMVLAGLVSFVSALPYLG